MLKLSYRIYDHCEIPLPHTSIKKCVHKPTPHCKPDDSWVHWKSIVQIISGNFTHYEFKF
jgi:hypothetical protein